MKTNTILQGDALTKLKELPEKSINMCMTSPPYWALRDYGTSVETIWDGDESCEHDFNMEKRKGMSGGNAGIEKERPNSLMKRRFEDVEVGFCNKCGAWKGQLGLEPTFDLYIKHLCNIFDEVKRVLRDDGTCWVNLGDTYNAGRSGGHAGGTKGLDRPENAPSQSGVNCKDLPTKSLVMIPFRFAIEMVNRGWILRNTIVWHKPNCMPTSTKDRFTVDFEYLFFFSKKKKYYFEIQYEPHTTKENRPDGIVREREFGYNTEYPEVRRKKPLNKKNPYKGKGWIGSVPGGGAKIIRDKDPRWLSPEGRNKRTVWSINPRPFSDYYCSNCEHLAKPKGKQEKKGYFGGEDKSKRVCEKCGKELLYSHFAIYPEELCETPIKAGCPKFVCEKCGNPYIKKLIPTKEYSKFLGKGWYDHNTDSEMGMGQQTRGFSSRKGNVENIKRYENTEPKPTCNCNAEFTSGIVLDPFFGAGTTGLVALKQNKKFIGIELNKEYIEIANKRLGPHLEQTKLK